MNANISDIPAKPAKLVMDYSEAERLAFQQNYTALFHRYKVLNRRVTVGLCVVGGGTFFLVVSAGSWGACLAVLFAIPLLLYLVILMADAVLPRCTACQMAVEEIATFCPECGGELVNKGMFKHSQCCYCGKIYEQKKQRSQTSPPEAVAW